MHTGNKKHNGARTKSEDAQCDNIVSHFRSVKTQMRKICRSRIMTFQGYQYLHGAGRRSTRSAQSRSKRDTGGGGARAHEAGARGGGSYTHGGAGRRGPGRGGGAGRRLAVSARSSAGGARLTSLVALAFARTDCGRTFAICE